MRECLFLFNAWDNFVLDKIRAKSSLAPPTVREKGRWFRDIADIKPLRFKFACYNLYPTLLILFPRRRLSRPFVRPCHRDCQIRKLSLIPAILNVRFSFFLSRSFSHTHIILPHPGGNQNFTSQPRTRVSRAVTAFLCENSLWSFRGFALKPSCLWARFFRYWHWRTSPWWFFKRLPTQNDLNLRASTKCRTERNLSSQANVRIKFLQI